MDTETRKNLETALHGEAFAHARYVLFAAEARKRGDERLAEMYDGMANVELKEHFAELAELAGLAGAADDNLVAAIQDENTEAHETYPAFARQARAAGEEAVAARFEEMAEDEKAHADALEAMVERLEVPT